MEFKQALKDLFRSPWVKSFPARSLVASVLAAIIHPVLAGVGFDVATAAPALAKIGFQVAGELLPSMLEVAKKGISALGVWLEGQISTQPEVNKAAAQILVEQAPQVVETIAQTHPEDKDEIASTFGQGLAESGGATAQIAELYQAAMKETAELKNLVEEMKSKIDVWASQTIEAKRGSMIENVGQRMKDHSGEQVIRAEDDSSISGAKQNIE